MRKHYTQMSSAERDAAIDLARSIQPALSLSHVHTRMVEKKVTIDEIIRCLQTGDVIEVHNNAASPRVLVRDSHGICVVFNIANGNVVTVWRNTTDDKHSTIDMRNYQWHDNLLPLLKRAARKVIH